MIFLSFPHHILIVIVLVSHKCLMFMYIDVIVIFVKPSNQSVICATDLSGEYDTPIARGRYLMIYKP